MSTTVASQDSPPICTSDDNSFDGKSLSFDFGAAIWILAALAPVLLAAVLQVGSGRQVILPGLNKPLPETCSMRRQFSIDCPGCGLTRGFIHVAHGRLGEAYAVHALSLPLFAFALLQLPLAIAHGLRYKHRFVGVATRWNQYLIVMLAGLMLVRWFWLIATGELF